jgi:hypothetical protein
MSDHERALLLRGARSSAAVPLKQKGLSKAILLSPHYLTVALATVHSVETFSCSLSAACIVCHDSVAHLTRTGNSRTPAKIFKRPS